ncbi:MAG: N-acetylmuramoyl-L-alanine amidase [Ruminococcus sp.]|nr:N-acetylmuramoyl-L-alanine amidase [Ruminococcus sp.]
MDSPHGGIDGGCTSAEGIPEKGINLGILLKLRDILTVSGFDVKVTRDSDISIHDKGVEGIAAQKSSDMDNRLEMFNSEKNAVCISIHQNQFTDPVYKGAQMFYSDEQRGSERLARSLQSRFSALLQPDNDREIKECGKELFLCYYSKNPTVMAECGFLSNPEEAALLNTEEYQTKTALTIFAGLSDYLAEGKS